MSDELFLSIVSDPQTISDPYPRLRELRETSPVHKVGFSNLWVLTRFEDCRSVLRDGRLGIAKTGDETPSLMPGAVYSQDPDRERSMLFLNPPEHTRLRSLVSSAFTRERLEGLRTSVEAMTGELLERLARAGGGDLIAELAHPLAAYVIDELVGVPREDRDGLGALIVEMTAALEPNRRLDDAQRAKEARRQAREYIGELVDRRQTETGETGDDLLSALIETTDGDDRLTAEEVAATVSLVYGAGFETTASLIGSIVHTLLRWPEQLDHLRSDRSLVPAAVEEVLRFEPPVQVDGRRAFADVEVDGTVIGAGHSVLMLLGAANRDPDVVDDPDLFDVARRECPLLSFGAGIHECLGAPLTRLAGQVVLEALLDRFGTWTPKDENPPWKPRLTLRGLARLPVALS